MTTTSSRSSARVQDRFGSISMRSCIDPGYAREAISIPPYSCRLCLAAVARRVPRAVGQQDSRRAAARVGSTRCQVASADANTGIVPTVWESTGQNRDGTIWAVRYIITLARDASASRITVGMDLRTCDPGLGTNPHTGTLDASSCARLPDGTTPVSYQEQPDRFAAALRAAL